jgi:hypothetical protein
VLGVVEEQLRTVGVQASGRKRVPDTDLLRQHPVDGDPCLHIITA